MRLITIGLKLPALLFWRSISTVTNVHARHRIFSVSPGVCQSEVVIAHCPPLPCVVDL